MHSPRILIADSSLLVRERLASALLRCFPHASISGVTTATELWDTLEPLSPEVAFIGAGLAGDALLEVVSAAARGNARRTRVVVLAPDIAGYSARCQSAGAHAVVDPSDADAVTAAVRSVSTSASPGPKGGAEAAARGRLEPTVGFEPTTC